MEININFVHEKNVQGVIRSAEKLINEYQGTDDILPTRLKWINKKLAGYYAYLIRRSAKYQGLQTSKYHIRKIVYSTEAIKARKAKNNGLDKDLKQNAADHVAMGRIKKEVEDECFAIWRYEDVHGFCKGIEKIIICIRGELEDYRFERSTAKREAFT
jgi:hypothetical protein